MTVDEALQRVREADLPDYFGRSIDSVHTTSVVGDTPLHVAAIWGDADMVGAFIEAGAQLDAQGEQEMTALHYAIEQGHTHCAHILVKAGASLRIKERMGLTAVELAELSDDPAIRSLFHECV